VPYYEVDYDVYLCDFDEIIDDIDELSEENERVLLWWHIPFFPTRKVAVVTKNRAGTGPGARLGGSLDLTDEVGPNLSKAPLLRELDDLRDAVSKVALGGECRHLLHRRGGYEDMLTIPLLPVYHRECEYAVPVEHTATALKALRVVLDEADAELRLPTEVRFVVADEDLLSPAHGRATCYIGVATLDNATEVFERFEPIMKELCGRPHWGKHSNATRPEIEAMYSDTFDAFVQLRQSYDPDGVFLNSLLRRLFE
jgi:FAD/FMN-containing dehydrogenase